MTKKPAPAPKKELRDTALHVKIKGSVKAMADAMCAEDERTLSDWLERLIRSEHERRTAK